MSGAVPDGKNEIAPAQSPPIARSSAKVFSRGIFSISPRRVRMMSSGRRFERNGSISAWTKAAVLSGACRYRHRAVPPGLRSDRRRAIPFNNLRLRHDVQSRAKRIEELEEFTDASRLLSALKLGNVPRPSSRKTSKRILRNLLFLADVAHLNADVTSS